MKRAYPKKIVLIAAVTGIAALATGCGSAGPGPAGAPGVNTNGVVGPGGCLPITQPIGFNATGIYLDSITVRAGMIPSIDPIGAGQVGAVTIMPGGTGGPYQVPNTQYPESLAVDGRVSMNIMPMNGVTVPGQVTPGAYGYSGNTSSGNATGTITLTPMKIQQVMASFGGYNTGMYPGGMYPGGMNPGGAYPYPGAPGYNPTMPNGMVGTGPCVTGVAVSMSRNGYNLYGGRVYLYLNTPGTTQVPNQLTPMGSGHGTFLKF